MNISPSLQFLPVEERPLSPPRKATVITATESLEQRTEAAAQGALGSATPPESNGDLSGRVGVKESPSLTPTSSSLQTSPSKVIRKIVTIEDRDYQIETTLSSTTSPEDVQAFITDFTKLVLTKIIQEQRILLTAPFVVYFEKDQVNYSNSSTDSSEREQLTFSKEEQPGIEALRIFFQTSSTSQIQTAPVPLIQGQENPANKPLSRDDSQSLKNVVDQQIESVFQSVLESYKTKHPAASPLTSQSKHQKKPSTSSAETSTEAIQTPTLLPTEKEKSVAPSKKTSKLEQAWELRGISNGGQNCWLNSMLQLLFSSKAFRTWIEEQPDLQTSDSPIIQEQNSSFISRIVNVFTQKKTTSQTNPLKLLHDFYLLYKANTHTLNAENLRQMFTGEYKQLQQSGTQQDPEEALRALSLLFSERDETQLLSIHQVPIESETNKLIEILKKHPPSSIESPNLWIDIKRCSSSSTKAGERAEMIKITDALDIPDRITLLGKTYQLKGHINHLGTSSQGGHYQAYVYEGDRVHCCNDATITEVDDPEEKERLKSEASILRYELIESSQ